jgi:hypothetical protein
MLHNGVWLTPVARATVEVLLLMPSLDERISFEEICVPSDIRDIISRCGHMSRVMVLGEMTDILQNGLLYELNVVL